jgi:hypothetical protein
MTEETEFAPSDLDGGDFSPPSLEQVKRWLVNARPGAQLVYGRGITAETAAAPGVAEYLHKNACHRLGKGFVALVQRRNPVGPGWYGAPFDYVAQRVAKRWDENALTPRDPVGKAGKASRGPVRHVKSWEQELAGAFR